VKLVARRSAAGYHEPSTHDARQLITTFFDAHLKP
jgi:hypothetical protein